MALPDISQLTLAELKELIATASLQYKHSEIEMTQNIETRKEALRNAISDLEALLGPENATPNTTNIRGVLGFTDLQMTQNAGLAFRLVFLGLEKLTETTLDIAKVVGNR